MENKHFSHAHNLSLHEIPEEAKIVCSGCNLPSSGLVYVCRQCNYFLHEQCFRASRSIKHPSHPVHPLTLIPYPTYMSGSFLCDSCGQIGSGFSFSCSSCDFDLHVHCACISQNTSTVNTESQTEVTGSNQIEHKSHAKHSLTLLSNREFVCNACREYGRDSAYNCSACDFDLHVECASLNEKVNREDHEHPLTLYYSFPSPYNSKDMCFECDVCRCKVSKDCWLYCCVDCDYGTHVNCVLAKARSKEEVELEGILAIQQAQYKLQYQMQLNSLIALSGQAAVQLTRN
ncbi:hypothetical protein HYC85_010924 [Camellia sinensis]|uniref:DC1 domain-containing protein n=1 Tax=Camellia sinensis TaxID=4442 RepID=A0A7J7HJA7_CAMSI|nr:hypothetical protein HYC85_010924 [Camellia sinensis]